MTVHVLEPTPMKNNFQNSNIWKGDGIEMFTGPNDLELGGNLQFDDRQIIIQPRSRERHELLDVVQTGRQPAIEMNVKMTEDGAGYVLDAAVPWSTINIELAWPRIPVRLRLRRQRRREQPETPVGMERHEQKQPRPGTLGPSEACRLSGALTGSGQFASRVSGAAGVNDKPSRVRVNNAGSFRFRRRRGGSTFRNWQKEGDE